ncbi:MAG: hypothetical protein GY906_24750 [bacterium]|nr:hypothetical protein [bacterium]
MDLNEVKPIYADWYTHIVKLTFGSIQEAVLIPYHQPENPFETALQDLLDNHWWDDETADI